MTVSSAPLDLLSTIRRELAPAEGGNRLVPLVAEGRLPRERLAALALGQLMAFARALGMDAGDLGAYEPEPGCQAYAAYVAWLALNGAQGDVALALVANFGAWGSYCGAVAEALRSRYGLDDEACGFFAFFATPVPEVEQQALAVAQASVEAGAPPERARRYARLIQAYELQFWNTLAEGVPETG